MSISLWVIVMPSVFLLGVAVGYGLMLRSVTRHHPDWSKRTKQQ